MCDAWFDVFLQTTMLDLWPLLAVQMQLLPKPLASVLQRWLPSAQDKTRRFPL